MEKVFFGGSNQNYKVNALHKFICISPIPSLTGLLHSILDESSVLHNFLFDIHPALPAGNSQARRGAVHSFRSLSRRACGLQHVMRR